MNKVLNFDDYLFNKIFENKKEITVVLSKRLSNLLDEINHPIAFKLLNLKRENVKSDKVAFIDYDDKNKGSFTYIIPNKLIEIIKKEGDGIVKKNIDEIYNLDYYDMDDFGKSPNYNFIWTKSRMSTSINKVVNKLFPNKYKPSGDPGNDLESFKNMVIAKREENDKIFERFKIVKGKDINKYYGEKYYDYSEGTSSLGQSCMRHEKCYEFLDFYADNGVEMVILMSIEEPNKIIGRSILWEIEYINDEKVDRKFMDRIYTVKDSYVDVFKEFAKKNGWLYKKNQNMDNRALIVDSKTNESDNYVLKTKSNFDETEYFPYMDTMKYYYYEEGFLTNISNFGYTYHVLDDTNGGPVNYLEPDGTYVEYYDDYYDEDDLIWCELGGEYRLEHDAIWIEYIEEYATQDYVNDYMVWSEHHDKYIHSDDAVYSEYLDSDILKEDTIEVYKENVSDFEYEEIKEKEKENKSDYIDYVDEYNLKYFIKYTLRDNIDYFNDNDKDNFINCEKLSDKNNVWAHKKWDKDKIIKWNNMYYYNDDQKSFDELVGQIRMFDNKNNKM